METNDSGGAAAGQIRIDEGNSNVLRFHGGTVAANFNGAEITRSFNLSGANTATISYSPIATSLEAGESDHGRGSAADGVNFVHVEYDHGQWRPRKLRRMSWNGPFAANAAVQFVGTAMNEINDVVQIDDCRYQPHRRRNSEWRPWR